MAWLRRPTAGVKSGARMEPVLGTRSLLAVISDGYAIAPAFNSAPKRGGEFMKQVVDAIRQTVDEQAGGSRLQVRVVMTAGRWRVRGRECGSAAAGVQSSRCAIGWTPICPAVAISIILAALRCMHKTCLLKVEPFESTNNRYRECIEQSKRSWIVDARMEPVASAKRPIMARQICLPFAEERGWSICNSGVPE
jgi:hypothetical protein